MPHRWKKLILGNLGLLILQIVVYWFISSHTHQSWNLVNFFHNPYILLFWAAYAIISIVLTLLVRLYHAKK